MDLDTGVRDRDPLQGGTDAHSTGDIWATVYRGNHVEQGETVGAADCGDKELEQIASGPFNTTSGSDIVAWVVVRHHREPRFATEERFFLPYHYEGFHIVPQSFELLRPSDRRPNPDRGGRARLTRALMCTAMPPTSSSSSSHSPVCTPAILPAALRARNAR